MSEDYTWQDAPVTTVTALAARVAELERQLEAAVTDSELAILQQKKLERENAELRTKLKVVQVYARGIYGEVPPISFEDWYALVRGEVQP